MIVIFLIHMQIKSPIGSDMRLALYKILRERVYRRMVKQHHPSPWRHSPAQYGTYVTFQEIAAVIPWKHKWTFNVIKHKMMIT